MIGVYETQDAADAGCCRRNEDSRQQDSHSRDSPDGGGATCPSCSCFVAAPVEFVDFDDDFVAVVDDDEEGGGASNPRLKLEAPPGGFRTRDVVRPVSETK
jgi:hypothetical protein